MLTSTAAILGLIAAIVTSLGIIHLKVIKPIFKAGKKVTTVFDKVMEYDDRLTVIEKNSRQLTNNGGSHLKDAVDRIEKNLEATIVQAAKNDASTKGEFLAVYKMINAADNKALTAAIAAAKGLFDSDARAFDNNATAVASHAQSDVNAADNNAAAVKGLALSDVAAAANAVLAESSVIEATLQRADIASAAQERENI